MQARVASVLVAAMLVASAARAEDDEFGRPLPPANRFALTAVAPLPLTIAARSGTAAASSLVGALTFEGRFNHGAHGALIAVGVVPASAPSLLFAGSPSVTYVDLAYSLLAVSDRHLRGVTGSTSFDVGPSVGFVGATPVGGDSATSSSPPIVEAHVTFGARLSLHLDVLLGPVVLGLVLGYRGGAPSNASTADRWEGIGFVNVELGFALE